jgi:hypothetical protein
MLTPVLQGRVNRRRETSRRVALRDRADPGNVALMRVLEKLGPKCDESATYFGRERRLYVDEEGNSAVGTDNDARGAASAGAS